MFKRFIAGLYGRLPVIRELRAIMDHIYQMQKSLAATQAIRLHDFDLNDHPRYADPLRLLRYQSQVCSQGAEDGMVHEIFRRIGCTNRIFAEVGVGNGVENNTAFLLALGWTGFWIDGSREFLGALKNRDDLEGAVLQWLVSFVSKENIGGLFEQLGVPKDFDLLSLDIDQNTYFAWDGLAGYRPRVVVVEYNASIPADVEWKAQYRPDRVWDGTYNFGASLKAFEMLGRRLGYSLVGCEFLGTNAFFVREDLAQEKFAAPFTAENHYEPPRFALAHRRSGPAAILDRKAAD